MHWADKGFSGFFNTNPSQKCFARCGGCRHTTQVWNVVGKEFHCQVGRINANEHDICNHSCFWRTEKVV